MFPANTPCLCDLITENMNNQEAQSVHSFFLFSRFKQIKFNIYVYIHIIFAKELFNLVICSGEVETLLITSPKTSSTLN